jgi:hypothetical protein
VPKLFIIEGFLRESPYETARMGLLASLSITPKSILQKATRPSVTLSLSSYSLVKLGEVM